MFQEKNNIIKMIKASKSGKMRVENIRKVLIKNCKFLKMLITLKIIFYSLTFQELNFLGKYLKL